MAEHMADAGLRDRFVEIRNAVKYFPTPEGDVVKALDNVSLSVGSNEFVTLLGPSGCGKTTLLRTISGFEDLDEGEIYLDGQPIAGIPPYRRPVNTVFQSYALFPHMSIGENVGYSLEVARVGRREREKAVAEVLELVGLTGLERRRPRQLSGGQQQRVALARAIIAKPKLLLLDEPLSALDRNLRQAMQLELKNIQHEIGISFVFVTHDQEEALTMSDRIVVLNSGKIQQIGTPTDIYDRPQTAFVAGFIGESNLFTGTLRKTDAPGVSEIATGDGLTIAVKSDKAEGLAGQQVTAVIRPEHFELANGTAANATEPPPGTAHLEGKLRQSLFVGRDYQLLVVLEGGHELKAILRDFGRTEVPALSPGSTVRLRYWLSAPHVLAGEVS
jgi:spermidine/putrescine transport system ATP-binding protein